MPFLRGALSTRSSELALDDGQGIWSYRDLAMATETMAGRLEEMEVQTGEPVGLLGPLSRTYLAALHGIWRVGAVAVPLNERWTGEEMARALTTLSVRLILVVEAPGGRGDRSAIPPDAKVLRLEEGSSQELLVPWSRGRSETDHRRDLAEPASEWTHREAARLLTSGTAGEPRSVSLTFGNLVASAHGARERLALEPQDRWLASLSVSHVGGLALVTRAALLGSGLVLRGGFNRDVALKAIMEGAVTHASLVPTMLERILEAWDGGNPVPPTLKCFLLGGAAAPVQLLERALARGVPLALTYGLTQATSQVATAPPGLVKEKPGTVGRPLPGVDVRVSGTGELLVRGPTVAQGEAEEDGWLRTGDLARMDEDGYLWVVGRLSDRIITGGVNVDPREVELILEDHPRVREAAVVGIPDPEWGERVVAALVLHGREGDEGQDVGPDLERVVRVRLSSAKRPRAVRFVEALPRNRNGKLDREMIRTLFL